MFSYFAQNIFPLATEYISGIDLGGSTEVGSASVEEGEVATIHVAHNGEMVIAIKVLISEIDIVAQILSLHSIHSLHTK